MNDLTPAERLERAVVMGLLRLPRVIQLKLVGGSPIRIDGEELNPQIQMILAARAWMEKRGLPPLGAGIPKVERKGILRDARVYGNQRFAESVVAKNLRILDSKRGATISARIFRIREKAPAPRALLVYFHGGGFVLGGLDSHDDVCRMIAAVGNVDVLLVAYRLAPEHPFPAGLKDAQTAFDWACQNAQNLGSDPRRVGVGGDSAGGNFAANVTRVAVHERANSGGLPAFQFLLYPPVDRIHPYPSLELFSEGFLLTRRGVEAFEKHYQANCPLSDPRLSPLQAASEFSPAFPKTLVITASFDPLRDEGEAYAKALQAAGAQVQLTRVKGMIHGFINLIGISPAAETGFREVCEMLREMVYRK